MDYKEYMQNRKLILDNQDLFNIVRLVQWKTILNDFYDINGTGKTKEYSERIRIGWSILLEELKYKNNRLEEERKAKEEDERINKLMLPHFKKFYKEKMAGDIDALEKRINQEIASKVQEVTKVHIDILNEKIAKVVDSINVQTSAFLEKFKKFTIDDKYDLKKILQRTLELEKKMKGLEQKDK